MPPPPRDESEFTGTLIETDDGIPAPVAQKKPGRADIPVAKAAPLPSRPVPAAAIPPAAVPAPFVPTPLAPASPPPPPPVPTPTAQPYRPTVRPPVPLLVICDDGKSEGEIVRLRQERTVIGRNAGDVHIPHDELISGEHVEIVRKRTQDGWAWIVTDLRSTNGLFIRVSRTGLTGGDVFLIGRGRYRYDEPQENAGSGDSEAARSSTVGWADVSETVFPTITEILARGLGQRLLLAGDEYWIGSDTKCHLPRPGDPFTEPRHAQLVRKSDGRWQIINNKTLNGVWYRVPNFVCTTGCVFQIGEQRLKLEVPE